MSFKRKSLRKFLVKKILENMFQNHSLGLFYAMLVLISMEEMRSKKQFNEFGTANLVKHRTQMLHVLLMLKTYNTKNI